MKLSFRGEYALLALVFLARQDPEGPWVGTSRIAREMEIPQRFLEQIMLILKRNGYVRSRKGKGGGFLLARPPERISLAEIVRLFDGALAPSGSVSRYFYEVTPVQREEGLTQVFRELRDQIAARLESTTIADVV